MTTPESWKDVKKASVSEVTTEGLKKLADVQVNGRALTVPVQMTHRMPYVAIPEM